MASNTIDEPVGQNRIGQRVNPTSFYIRPDARPVLPIGWQIFLHEK
jgi:hypothetical protein